MNTNRSAVNRIRAHMTTRGCNTPVNRSRREDLVTLVRRCEDVQGLTQEYGPIELSPYLRSLLQVSGVPASNLAAAGAAVGV